MQYSYLLQLQAKYIPNMVKNSAAQYEVVVVDDEDELNGSGGIGGSIQRHQRLR